jgi:lysophospholipase L1-like esterase
VTWRITSQAGAGWGEGQNTRGNWPLGIVQGDWAAKRVTAAASKRRVATVAIELGTNDALRASFAFVTNSSTDLAARITGTDNNVSRVVKLASSLSRCVVLVTPSYYPPTTFGSEVHYSEQAWGIRAELLKQASIFHRRTVVIADWASLSSPHHLPSGAARSWFTDDGLHPNTVGERALAALIVRTADTCPSSSIASR